MGILFRGGTLPKSQQTQKSSKWGSGLLKGAPRVPKSRKIIHLSSQNLENPIAELLCKCNNSLHTDSQKRVDHMTAQLQVRSDTTSSTTHRVWLFETKNTVVLPLWGGCGGAQPPHHTTQSLDKNIPTVMVFVTAILQGLLCAPTSFYNSVWRVEKMLCSHVFPTLCAPTSFCNSV